MYQKLVIMQINTNLYQSVCINLHKFMVIFAYILAKLVHFKTILIACSRLQDSGESVNGENEGEKHMGAPGSKLHPPLQQNLGLLPCIFKVNSKLNYYFFLVR